MGRDVNRVMLTGRLGKDVELKVTANGVPVATFTVASGRGVKQPDGSYKDQTEWFRCVAWERQAETASTLLKKGSHVYVEGRLQTREWNDTQGQKRYTTEVVVSDFNKLDNKPAGEQGPGNEGGLRAGATTEWTEDEELEPEDIPF